MQTQHFLLTRFNLRLPGISLDWQQREVLGEGWLAERVDLFERYCLPSVAAQTHTDFRWLVLLDEGSPPELLARFDGYARDCPVLETVLLPPVDHHRVIADAVCARVQDRTDVLITSRLDNDDAIHERFMEVARSAARGRREFLNFRWGWVHDGDRALLHSERFGHFMSLVEPRADEPFVTAIHSLPHGRSHQVAPVRQLKAPPFWLDTMHGRNVYARMPEGWDRHDFRSLRGIARFVRDGISRPLRARLAWPRLAGRAHALADVAGPFHVGG